MHASDRWCADTMLLFALLFTAGSVGCPAESETEDPNDFFQQPLAKRPELFAELGPEDQVRVYMASQRRHPRDYVLCRELGERSGARAIPHLVTALSLANESHEKVSALRGLACVAEADSAACDEQVVASAKAAASSVRGEVLRAEAQEAVARISCEKRLVPSDANGRGE